MTYAHFTRREARNGKECSKVAARTIVNEVEQGFPRSCVLDAAGQDVHHHGLKPGTEPRFRDNEQGDIGNYPIVLQNQVLSP
jgi:hypothetical protein